MFAEILGLFSQIFLLVCVHILSFFSPPQFYVFSVIFKYVCVSRCWNRCCFIFLIPHTHSWPKSLFTDAVWSYNVGASALAFVHVCFFCRSLFWAPVTPQRFFQLPCKSFDVSTNLLLHKCRCCLTHCMLEVSKIYLCNYFFLFFFSSFFLQMLSSKLVDIKYIQTQSHPLGPASVSCLFSACLHQPLSSPHPWVISCHLDSVFWICH